jgi:DNA-binding transcriptional regulator YdaS (Cro superfamily)
MDKCERPSALDRAIEIAGSAKALSERLGLRKSAVTMWRIRGRVPPEHCGAIEILTKGKVKRRQLRPDVFA